ncbi:bifunctional protein FolD-like [Tropilaelaps mercedesae]|uniref:Bifunctional protein FolD-like n=1 Tax=Tropilaelaps mercedesae TaxID=418985 RepID=A0A1V9XYV6_9ACAR|nr:bifunctional protein FolD-like [Tropilaelaps mercedesae]
MNGGILEMQKLLWYYNTFTNYWCARTSSSNRRFYGRYTACRILDGRSVARVREGALRHHVKGAKPPPSLAVFLVGHNPASEVFVRKKQMACARVGILFHLIRMHDSVKQEDLVHEIHRLNQNPSIHGVIVQLPLPAAMNANQVCSEVLPLKDVDCFTPENVGKLCHGNPLFVPCAPKAVLTLLEEADTALESTNTLMIGRSNLVGQPLSMMLGHRGATVATAHSLTPPDVLLDLCRWANLVVSAAGVPHLVRGGMVRPGAVVIDVGINRLPEGGVVGDVHFDEVRQKASVLTPVPGGVGPLTVVSLLENTFLAYELQNF